MDGMEAWWPMLNWIGGVLEAVGGFLGGALSIALGAFLAALGGLEVYYRQKEHESLRRRYLEECVDALAQELDAMMANVAHNAHVCMDILRAFRDAPSDYDFSPLLEAFQPVHSAPFNRVAQQRLRKLLGDDFALLWDLYQLTLARLAALNSRLHRSIATTLHHYHAQVDDQQRHAVASKVTRQLAEMEQERERYAVVLGSLLDLAEVLEGDRRFRPKTLSTFRRLERVEEILANLAVERDDLNLSPDEYAALHAEAPDALAANPGEVPQ